jgi:hypothetical protein
VEPSLIVCRRSIGAHGAIGRGTINDSAGDWRTTVIDREPTNPLVLTKQILHSSEEQNDQKGSKEHAAFYI